MTASQHPAEVDQVVCTLEGMANMLLRTPGDFAVVIHGDRDCLNVLAGDSSTPGLERFFSTGLSEDEIAAGRSPELLHRCLEAVCRQLRPVRLFVLGTCLSVLSGEDIERIAAAVSRETGVAIDVERAAGMGFVRQTRIIDRHACLMLPEQKPQGPSGGAAVNLVGFEPGPEMREMFEPCGLELNAVLNDRTPCDEWQRVPRAGHNVVVDGGLYRDFLATCRRRWGQRRIQVPLPVGARATLQFLRRLARQIPEADLPEDVRRTCSAGQALVKKFRPQCRGVRLGYNIGSMKNLDPATLARLGLACLPFFEELGFDVVLLVQGDDRADRQRSLQQALSSWRCRYPMEFFHDTVQFGDTCRRTGCQLVFASDHLREQARGAGVGLLAIGSLELGPGAALERNLERVERALAGRQVLGR